MKPDEVSGYLQKPYPAMVGFIALSINVILLAALLWAAITLARHSGKAPVLRSAQWMFLAVLTIPMHGIYLQFFNAISRSNLFRPLRQILGPDLIQHLRESPTDEAVMLCVIVLAFGVIVLISGRQRVIRVAVVVLLILSPFVLFTFYQAARISLESRAFEALAKDKPSAPPLTSTVKSGPNVLWIVFDEMELRLPFLQRPPKLKLPELDGLRNQAVFANNAYPPAEWTRISMPAYITGRLISRAAPVAPDKLMITFHDDKKSVGWDTQPNIFSRAREAGLNTALVGWYHPYCRVIGDALTNCSWQPAQDYSYQREQPTIIRSMLHWFHIIVIKSLPYLHKETVQTPEYLSIKAQAKRLITDKSLNLILVHLPIPHLPGIYDRYKDDFSLDSDKGYLDNLELADRTLGELRREMESAGTWDDTIVLVTSDHWWRWDKQQRAKLLTEEDTALLPDRIDHRIPFILKLAGQKEGLIYDPAFNTVLTHDLLLALLRAEVSSPDGVVDWLDRRRSSVKPPRFQKSQMEEQPSALINMP